MLQNKILYYKKDSNTANKIENYLGFIKIKA